MAKNNRQPFDPEGFIAKVQEGRCTKTWPKNQTVFAQGDIADAVYYIQEGQVKVSVVSEQGKEAIVAIPGRDEFFGESCLAGQTLRLASALTLTECQLVRLEKSAILKLLADKPAFARTFIQHILERTMRVEADLVDQLFNSSEKRLARTLLLLANYGKEGEPKPIITQLSQETLAEMIGTTRSRVSFFMNKFRKLGFIEYNGGGIRIHRSLLNVLLNDEPQIVRYRLGGESCTFPTETVKTLDAESLEDELRDEAD